MSWISRSSLEFRVSVLVVYMFGEENAYCGFGTGGPLLTKPGMSPGNPFDMVS